MNRLLETPRPLPKGVLVTGTTGLLGSLLATSLLEAGATVVAPVRSKHQPDDVWASIAEELSARSVKDTDALRARFVVTELPAHEAMRDLQPLCEQHGVTDIVHAAGSVDYFQAAVLEEANIRLTEALLDLAKALGNARFSFVSTAFASGFRDGAIPEALHDEPESDPTEYTRSKRRAEHLVAGSGVPYLILRPSVVIGDSRDGRYRGKPYGVYQFYAAGERLLLDKYHPEIHMVAPRAPLQVVHQDAFVCGALAAMQWLCDGGVVHLVSNRETLPTMRDILEVGVRHITPFERVLVYDRLEQVPTKELSRRMRMLVEFASVNTEIAVHPWPFATDTLNALRAKGVQLGDASPGTVETCLRWYIEQSARYQKHRAEHKDKLDVVTQFVEVGDDIGRAAG